MGELNEILRVARDRFGFEELRPGQEEAVAAVTAGRDTLVVMTTGSGKSAIYQLAGWMIEGATLVISPLISLQRDQVENIEEEQPGEAAAIDASVSDSAREERLDGLGEEIEFLFLAPEQLARCEAGHGRAEDGDRPFELGARVAHGEWGQGVVQRYDGDHVVVLFDSAGYKTLSVELVTERGLLEAVS